MLMLSELGASIATLAIIAGIALLAWPVFNGSSKVGRAALFAIAMALVLRYMWWRATQTLAPFGLTLDCLASWSFFAIEAASLIGSLSSFVIFSRLRERGTEVDANLGWWGENPPRVAVLIATYNEEQDILERTIIGAQALRHQNKEVVILDDGRRDWLRDLCEHLGVRYMRRADNRGSKAGNLNNALEVLANDPVPPDFIAVLDADFVPHRGFISRSLALFHDPSVALVQTPQHFFNADPIQHNLNISHAYPDEQRLFFDHLQPSRDGWDIAFCCGTSSMIRWDSLRAIGGFPTDSITEDFMLTLALQDGVQGRTVYLNEPLTEGLAPEGLKEYVTQRARWCLGLMQIARSRLGPLGRNNLRLRDRWSVADSVLYWSATFSFKIAALIYPLFYWFFNVTVVDASVADVISYFGAYYLWVLLALNIVSRGTVVPVLNDVSQLLGAIPIVRATVVGLIRPHGHPFSVTAKGGDRSGVVIQWSLMWPFLVLFVLTLIAITIGIFIDRFAFNDAVDGKTVILFWSLYNLLVLATVIVACIETPREEVHITDTPERAALWMDGRARRVWVSELTRAHADLRAALPEGSEGVLRIDEVGDVEGTVVYATADRARFVLRPTREQAEALILRLHTRDIDQPGVVNARLAPIIEGMLARLSGETRRR
ncbi:MAG: glycosyltransferase [Paracoccus sp. (in: a-proteobacteria)]|nr:glycosyltransferase [Paracoccus sp. (in: a-proteobacteria)]